MGVVSGSVAAGVGSASAAGLRRERAGAASVGRAEAGATAPAGCAGADRADAVTGGTSRAAPRSRPLLADVNPTGRSWLGDAFLAPARPGGTGGTAGAEDEPGDVFLEVGRGGTVGAGDELGGAPDGAVLADAPVPPVPPVGEVPVGRGRG